MRARLVDAAGDYPWSSAGVHLGGRDATGLLDWGWQRAAGIDLDWSAYLGELEGDAELEKCTYAGRPFGDARFVTEVGERFGRQWTRGRPKKKPGPASLAPDDQAALFGR